MKTVTVTMVLLAASVTISLLLLAGCEATAHSDRTEPKWHTTASYDSIMSEQAVNPSPIAPRQWPATQAVYQPCTVTHFGSYFDDDFVYLGDGDDLYGWTWRDAVAFGYSPARFVVNTVCVPLSMVKEPPAVLVTTDIEQRDHKEPQADQTTGETD